MNIMRDLPKCFGLTVICLNDGTLPQGTKSAAVCLDAAVQSWAPRMLLQHPATGLVPMLIINTQVLSCAALSACGQVNTHCAGGLLFVQKHVLLS